MMKWYGESIVFKARKVSRARLTAAGSFITRQIRIALSVRQPTKGKGSRKRGLEPSKPGEYPRIVIGSFRRAVNYEVSPVGDKKPTVRVGTNDPRGLWFELGTRKMARRPWLMRTVQQYRADIERLMGTGKVDP